MTNKTRVTALERELKELEGVDNVFANVRREKILTELIRLKAKVEPAPEV